MVKVAKKRPHLELPIKHAIYDLSEPFQGCSTVLVYHRNGRNYIYEVKGHRAGRAIGDHSDVTDPDETIRGMGYWVQA